MRRVDPFALVTCTALTRHVRGATQGKQDVSLPAGIDPAAADKIIVAPGTGGPDDVGDVEVNEEDINLPPFGTTSEAPD